MSVPSTTVRNRRRGMWPELFLRSVAEKKEERKQKQGAITEHRRRKEEKDNG